MTKQSSLTSKIVTNEDGSTTYIGDTFKVTLKRYSDPERLNAARNAALYLGKSDIGNTKRPLGIIEQGHVPEVFRGEMAEFIFEDVSKEVYDHLITYTTRNMRVAGGNRALRSEGVTIPSDRTKNLDFVQEKAEASMQNYYDLLDAGETKQVARSAMPIGAKLNLFVFQFNLLTLGEALFRQRIWERGAQGNTVKVVQAMFELVYQVDPQLWDTFYQWNGEPAADWIAVRRKLKKKEVTLQQFLSAIQNTEVDISAPLEDVLKVFYGGTKSMWD